MKDSIPLEEPSIEGDIVALTAEIVSTYAGRSQMSPGDLPTLIRSVHQTLTDLSRGANPAAVDDLAAAPPVPAVPIKESVGKDAIICLECGNRFKTLKRHLNVEHNLSPSAYRNRWQLSKDYPLVAPSYSASRAKTAKKIGLGRKLKDQ
jgi:predicted transcriptional regulator